MLKEPTLHDEFMKHDITFEELKKKFKGTKVKIKLDHEPELFPQDMRDYEGVTGEIDDIQLPMFHATLPCVVKYPATEKHPNGIFVSACAEWLIIVDEEE